MILAKITPPVEPEGSKRPVSYGESTQFCTGDHLQPSYGGIYTHFVPVMRRRARFLCALRLPQRDQDLNFDLQLRTCHCSTRLHLVTKHLHNDAKHFDLCSNWQHLYNDFLHLKLSLNHHYPYATGKASKEQRSRKTEDVPLEWHARRVSRIVVSSGGTELGGSF